MIYRKPQRTEQYDLSQLNQPDFISTFEYKEFIYFFFRENAMETMNCGPTIYSRVARVCKNDKGGPYQFNNRWTSFVKTRLNCSIPGDYPFYFNELKATSQIVLKPALGPDADHHQQRGVIYAVFQTPDNSIPGSAVCAFDFDDIEAAFNGRFKGQKDSNSNWMPVDHVSSALFFFFSSADCEWQRGKLNDIPITRILCSSSPDTGTTSEQVRRGQSHDEQQRRELHPQASTNGDFRFALS